jgi:hypothetical protein
MNLDPYNLHERHICTGGPPKQMKLELFLLADAYAARQHNCITARFMSGRPQSINAGSVNTNRQCKPFQYYLTYFYLNYTWLQQAMPKPHLQALMLTW